MYQQIIHSTEQSPDQREERTDQPHNIPPSVGVIPKADIEHLQQEKAADKLDQRHGDCH